MLADVLLITVATLMQGLPFLAAVSITACAINLLLED